MGKIVKKNIKMRKKTKKSRKLALAISATVASLAVIAVVAFTFYANQTSLALASKVHESVRASLKTALDTQMQPSLKLENCVYTELLRRRCTLIDRYLFTDKDTSQETIEAYLNSNGWLDESRMQGKTTFFTQSPPTAVVSASAHVMRHTNEPATREGAVTSRLHVVESKELPEPNGKTFRDTGFSYTDTGVYERAKRQRAGKYYLMIVETDYYRVIW